MRKYVIMGVQGSGKGTQSELLCDDLGLVHIAVGDIFRWHVQNHTKLGAQVRMVHGTQGVNFAVWAPAAGYVSVIGDFNGWNKTSHPLQPR